MEVTWDPGSIALELKIQLTKAQGRVKKIMQIIP